ncbi:MAG: gfo/Idh/MocA family oxidoreductase, partial [Pirellulales bacterium]
APVLSTSESPGAGAVVGKQALEAGPVSRGYTEEIEHFAWCIRNFDYESNQPKCHPEVALADAVIALTSNLAMSAGNEGRRIEFKREWFDIDSDATPDGEKPSTAV